MNLPVCVERGTHRDCNMNCEGVPVERPTRSRQTKANRRAADLLPKPK